MKTASMFVISSFLFATGCVMDPAEGDLSSDVDLASSGQRTSFATFAGDGISRSSAVLDRGSEYELELESTVEADHVVTAWLCGWTNPDSCTGGEGANQCGTSDHGSAAAGWFCQYGGGGIANSKGELEILSYTDPGAVNADTTEFRVILRTHGVEIPGMLEEQITTANGGCDINACANIQYAQFAALN